MKPIIINMDEMSDSKEVYESKPGKAGIIFLYSIFALVIISILWMVFGEIDEVVRARGVIRPNSDISTVVNQTEGKISKVCVEDGEAVKKGDTLYQVDCKTQKIKKSYLEQQIKELTEKKDSLLVYKRSVKADNNLFTNEKEEYRVQFTDYLIRYKNAIHSEKYEKQSNKYKIKSNQKQLLKKRVKLEFYKKLSNSIRQETNLFKDIGEESEFYNLYQQYVSGYKKISQQYDIKKQEIDVSTARTGLVNSIVYYTEQEEGLELLIKSVKSGKDCFEKNSSYRLKYQEYEQKVEQLQQEYQSALEDYNLNFELQEYGISVRELEESEEKVDTAKRAISAFKTSFLVDARQQLSETKKNLLDTKNQKGGLLNKKTLIRNNEMQKKSDLNTYSLEYKARLNNTISELEEAINTLVDSIEALKLEQTKVYQYSGQKDSTVKSLKINELKTTIENITACENQLEELESQLKTVQFEIDNANMVAAIDGVVNNNINLVTGDVLTAGAQVMTIIPIKDSAYKVNIYVANRNIGKLKKGMKVKLSLDALPNSEYGYLTGTILNISNDIKIDSENIYGYYLMEATIDGKKLYDKNGEEADIKSGMCGQVKIIVGEKSIFQYVMEKLNLWVNS